MSVYDLQSAIEKTLAIVALFKDRVKEDRELAESVDGHATAGLLCLAFETEESIIKSWNLLEARVDALYNLVVQPPFPLQPGTSTSASDPSTMPA